jgi:hypothetical protein
MAKEMVTLADDSVDAATVARLNDLARAASTQSRATSSSCSCASSS